MRLGAVTLALLTVAAIWYGTLNFQQRLSFVIPDDGVTWTWDDTARGVRAVLVAPNSPAASAGIKKGDILLAMNGAEIKRAMQVTEKLWALGAWTKVQYKLERDGKEFETPLVTEPQRQPASLENYLRIVGLLYLFIGLFIFARRWTAPRAVHFYVFCLISYIAYAFHYSGKLSDFDWQVYWSQVVALLLQPALLLHFSLVFPERRSPRGWLAVKLAGVYALPAALFLLHLAVAVQWLDLVPSIGARILLDQLELGYVGAYFVLAAVIFLLSYRRAPSGVLRQQLKWVTGGTFAGILPFFLFYILPFVFGAVPQAWWMKSSALSLALIPLCFGYAIIRYRLMDVDIIFKRGLAYTAATAGVVVVYFLAVGVIGEIFHTRWPQGSGGGVIAIVVAAFLFQPFRDWIQARLDRFFYRDRLDYRRTLIEFGRTLTNEVRLDPMLASALDRISQALLVDRVAIFVEDAKQPGRFQLARAMGVSPGDSPDLSFLDAGRLNGRNLLFFESARGAHQESEAARRTLELLDLNYFIPCRVRERAVAVLGLGKTVDGDFLSSEDVELLQTIADYVGIAIDNARLYESLEQKAIQIERLKDFSENIVESLNVGVLAVDLDGRIDSWNTQLDALLGVPRAQALGKKLHDVFPPDLMIEISARSGEERVSGVYKFLLRNRAGLSLVVNVSIAPLVGKSGEKLGRLILIEDITQRMNLEEQLVQNEKLTSLGLLAAGVAHEVNTPLAVISNHIQMLARQLPGDDPRHKIIDKIVKQTFRASEIVNSLLNFSRTAGSEFRDVNLNDLIDETLSLVAHPFRTGRVNVIRSLEPELPPVYGSTNRLQQVFLNLFLNARDAMPNGGMLEVRTACYNGAVEVEVTDTGVGIPRDLQNRIFDPFFTTKQPAGGTGLGLSVSYGIIKDHAGKIEVRSTPGKGTSFRLEFPVARKAVNV